MYMWVFPFSKQKSLPIYCLIFCICVNSYLKGEIMRIYSKWKDEEVIKLFKFIEEGKKDNIPLIKLFADYATMTNRKPNSVRNYYYIELDALQEDEKRRNRLGIDIKKHEKNDQKEFSLQETKDLVKNILQKNAKGISVRKACLELAGGDISLMVRYQNKFRTVVIKQKEIYESCLEELQKEGVSVKRETPNNVLTFKNNRMRLTESDINSLFLGLVKLVKKQASEEASKEFMVETEKANAMLRKTLINLRQKENEVKALQKNFKLLSQENERLCEELKLLRGKNAELISSQSRMQGLKKFANKYKSKNISTN